MVFDSTSHNAHASLFNHPAVEVTSVIYPKRAGPEHHVGPCFQKRAGKLLQERPASLGLVFQAVKASDSVLNQDSGPGPAQDSEEIKTLDLKHPPSFRPSTAGTLLFPRSFSGTFPLKLSGNCSAAVFRLHVETASEKEQRLVLPPIRPIGIRNCYPRNVGEKGIFCVHIWRNKHGHIRESSF